MSVVDKLPVGWIEIVFDEAIDVISDRGVRIQQKAYLPEGALPVVDQGDGLIGGYTNDLAAQVVGPSPVIIFGDHTRRFKFVKFPFAVGADGVKLFAPTDLWFPEFLYLQLGTVDLENRGYGRHYQQLRKKSLALPPRAEQARIVSKLEELLTDLDAGVVELKAAQNKLTQYRQSLLKAVVEGALTAEWRATHPPTEIGARLLERILIERRARWEAKQIAKFAEQGKTPPKDWQKKYPEPVQPDTTDLPVLPEGWVWASLDQCSLDEAAITDGPFGSNLKSSHYQEAGPRVIRLQNIGDGMFVDAKSHISKDHYEKLTKHAVEKDDLVVAMLGEVLPRACIIPQGVSPAIVKADCARVRLNTNLVIPYVVMSQLNSKPVRNVVLKFVKGIGRPRINLGHIRSIPLAVCSMEEQREIERVLFKAETSIEDQLKAINLSLKQSAAQRQSILRAAFAGKLVPQDPNDEPASALLELVRSERVERAKKPKALKTKKNKGIATMARELRDVLAEAGDWMPAQDAFRLCGVTDGTLTERVEELYAELRKLDVVEKHLEVKPELDSQGRKIGDLLKLKAQ